MFASLNLFKSVNCPYYSSNTNTNTCERPYCLFRHYNPPSQSQQNTTQVIPLPVSSVPISANPNEKKAGSENGILSINELPIALENLSNALQTVQDLFKLNNNNNNVSTSASGSSSIANQLNNLSTSLLSSVADSNILLKTTSTSNSNVENKSTTSTISRKQKTSTLSINAPVYNPTPILELKKINHQIKIENNEIITGNKRKLDLQSDNSDNDSYENHHNNSNVDSELSISNIVNSCKVEESNKKSKVAVETSIDESNSSKETASTKYDMASFAKLKPSQQLLKRYEILNKPIVTKPIVSSDQSGKLKKETNDESKTKKSMQDKSVPHLIMDSSTNAPKVPLAMRQRYLNFIFENGKTSFATIEKACEKASEQEKSIYDRSKNKTIYINLAANLIKSLRDQHVQQKQQQQQVQSSTNNKTLVNNPNKLINQKQVATYSHETMLNGPKAARIGYSINRVKQIEIKDLTVNQLYQVFYSYILTEKQLEENSFPNWMTTVNNLNVKKKNQLACIPNFNSQSNKILSIEKSKDNSVKPTAGVKVETDSSNTKDDIDTFISKICKRCNRPFQITSKSYIYSPKNSECIYHWGKLRSSRFNKQIEQKYSCCSGDFNAEGCETGKHVYDGDYDGNGEGLNIGGYVETTKNLISENETSSKSSKNIFALDCEMCYTTKGLELARVSIVDVNLKDIYESIVKPDYQILDYNTRWSGLTEESFRNCNKKITQVQADLLKLFNKDTILIGHSLDSDFKALKLIHKTVIDTSVVFPHKMGPPFKRALRNLMSEHLQKTIQDDADGHDSKEDANSCIQLMLYKINEDLKLKKPAFLKEIQTLDTTTDLQPSVSTSSSSVSNVKTTTSNFSTYHYQSQQILQQQSKIQKQKTNNLTHVLSPQAIAKAKLLAKTQSYNATNLKKFNSKI